ncbi:hypothetical protein B0H17DRAFT_1079548 [Mycena rosella]|uniref:Uncharacterized protein n=1 Tax=Mycena rosella TaxID=1033263 RepID=A0AAD7D488_MYCRO|nr:hypothetical protein B0H17DRAFT_1079548 [Mycena rosella]
MAASNLGDFQAMAPVNMPTLVLADLKATIRAEKFMEYEHRMQPDTLELLTLTVQHPTFKEIGSVTALRVRHRCYGIFLEVMDIDTELFTIGSAIFDKYGEIRPWLVDNEYHKGSGVWGRELNEGRLIFVICVSLKPSMNRFFQLYASEYVRKRTSSFVGPGVPIPRPPQEQWVSAFDGIVDFFRKVGYRRIGGTSFFAYSQDPDHPSRKMDRLDDFDPDEKLTGGIVQIIHNAHSTDPTSIHQPDSKGFRPIFVAVMSNNLRAVRTLISLGMSNEDLNSRENSHLLPLEACCDEMRSTREFEEIFIPDGWKGFSDTNLLIKAALKRAMGHTMPDTDEDFIPKHLWPDVFKTFILGYGAIMKAIGQLLSRFILRQTPPYVQIQAAQFYFKKGGRVEYALDAIIELPKEFDVVRKKMGLDLKQTCGPYSMIAPQTRWTIDSDDSLEEDRDESEEGGDGEEDDDSEEDGEESEEDGGDSEEDDQSEEGGDNEDGNSDAEDEDAREE